MMQNQLKGTPIPIEPCQMNGKAQILFAMRDPQWGEFKDTKVTDKMGEQWRNLGRKSDSQSDYFVERFDQSPVYLLVWLSSVHLLVWLSDVHLLVWLSDVHLLVVVRSQAGRERDWRDCTCGNYGEDERIGPNSCLW
jgi:hypothetical protein